MDLTLFEALTGGAFDCLNVRLNQFLYRGALSGKI